VKDVPMDKQTKTCRKCGHERPLGVFYPHRRVCKVCVVAQLTAYRQANYEAVRAREIALESKPWYREIRNARRREARLQGSNS
jgi:hypothetical protein